MGQFGKFRFQKGHYSSDACTSLKDFNVVDITNVSTKRIKISVRPRPESPVNPKAHGSFEINPGVTVTVEADRVNAGQIRELAVKGVVIARESVRQFEITFA